MSLLSDTHVQTPRYANDLLYSHQKGGMRNSAPYSFQQITANSAVKMYILHTCWKEQFFDPYLQWWST